MRPLKKRQQPNGKDSSTLGNNEGKSLGVVDASCSEWRIVLRICSPTNYSCRLFMLSKGNLVRPFLTTSHM